MARRVPRLRLGSHPVNPSQQRTVARLTHLTYGHIHANCLKSLYIASLAKIGCLRLLTGLIGVTLGLAAAAWLLALGAWWVRGEWTRLASAGPVSPAEALMVGCCATALAVATLLWVLTALEATSQVFHGLRRTHSRVGHGMAPAVVRRAVAIALGLAVTTSALPAMASAATPQPVAAAMAEGTPSPAIGAVRDVGFRPTASVMPGGTVPAPAANFRATAPTVKVQPMLDPRPRWRRDHWPRRWWSYGRHPLEHRGRPSRRWRAGQRIAAAWPQWYAANAAVIGPDPNLLRPG